MIFQRFKLTNKKSNEIFCLLCLNYNSSFRIIKHTSFYFDFNFPKNSNLMCIYTFHGLFNCCVHIFTWLTRYLFHCYVCIFTWWTRYLFQNTVISSWPILRSGCGMCIFSTIIKLHVSSKGTCNLKTLMLLEKLNMLTFHNFLEISYFQKNSKEILDFWNSKFLVFNIEAIFLNFSLNLYSTFLNRFIIYRRIDDLVEWSWNFYCLHYLDASILPSIHTDIQISV